MTATDAAAVRSLQSTGVNIAAARNHHYLVWSAGLVSATLIDTVLYLFQSSADITTLMYSQLW